jgi:hypothetical protein
MIRENSKPDLVLIQNRKSKEKSMGKNATNERSDAEAKCSEYEERSFANQKTGINALQEGRL